MGYDFENIDSQINSLIASVGSKKFSNSDSNKCLENLKLECEKITTVFKRQTFCVENETALKRYFHFHQEVLIALINRTSSQGSKINATILVKVRDLLVSLLKTMENKFSEYFDQSLKFPDHMLEALQEELAEFVEFVSFKFKPTRIDPELLNLVLQFLPTSDQSTLSFSFGRMYFLRTLKFDLEKVDTSLNEPELLKMDFCQALINNNYNSQEFFKYYTAHINISLLKCETLSDRIDQVAYYYKLCCQAQCLQKIAFDPTRPSINVQLLEWISQELDYLKQKQQLQLSQGLRDEGLNKDFKLNFDLSVSHLAYLFKSFIETGVIQNKNISELIRFLSKFVKTKKSEAVSYESLRIKFYNTETGTKDAVKKTLQSLLNYMNKN